MTPPRADRPGRDRISLATATAIAVANMVGTGVFTSLGFQLLDIRSGFAILLLWIVGGVFALCGALTYGELAAALPRSGGEFNYLGRIYHPSVGFLAGWISFVMGFALPIALAAMAFGSYVHRVLPMGSPEVLSSLLVVAVTVVHLRNLRFGSVFQNVATVFKVGLVLVFIGAAFFRAEVEVDFAPSWDDLGVVAGAPFGVALLYVMYAYAGWNASTYIFEEVRRPEVNVPRSLVMATAIVLALYVGLNWAFLVTAPMDELAGKIDVGHVSAAAMFGPGGGQLMSAMLSIALVSTISAMVWAGPRVTQVIGQDYAFFAALARTNRRGIPVPAIVLQSAIVLALIWTASFQTLLVYTQFALASSSALTVFGVFYLRWKAPDLPRPYRTWGYPFTPALFLLISVVTVGWTLMEHPWESLAGLATVLLGLPIYWLSPRSASPSVTADRRGSGTFD
ncbi:MAG: amino acid permease [Acidobacteriota bacterium]